MALRLSALLMRNVRRRESLSGGVVAATSFRLLTYPASATVYRQTSRPNGRNAALHSTRWLALSFTYFFSYSIFLPFWSVWFSGLG